MSFDFVAVKDVAIWSDAVQVESDEPIAVRLRSGVIAAAWIGPLPTR